MGSKQSDETGDTPQQIENRIGLWRDLILNPSGDPCGPSLASLLDTLEADVRAHERSDSLRLLLGPEDDSDLIETIMSAVSEAQTHGHVEYKRRVGPAGRRTIAQTVLWRLREHLSTPPG